MVEDRGQVTDAGRAGRGGGAQGEVVVLAAVEAIAKPAKALQQRAPIDAEMADQIVAEKKVRIPVGLEIGRMAPPLGVYLVLVGINQVGIGVPLELGCNQIEGVLGQQVV